MGYRLLVPVIYIMHKEKELFYKFLAEKGLNQTWQREVILDVFVNIGEHVSTNRLTTLIQKKSPSIGIATVYRTLQLIKECGIASQIDFGDGKRYEPSRDKEHHDHFFCTRCGEIIEFLDMDIEQLQEKLASKYGFKIKSHRMELYGLCKECNKNLC